MKIVKNFIKSIALCNALLYNYKCSKELQILEKGGELMEDKIKELIKIVKLLEKLVIALISLIGWILILIEIFK